MSIASLDLKVAQFYQYSLSQLAEEVARNSEHTEYIDDHLQFITSMIADLKEELVNVKASIDDHTTITSAGKQIMKAQQDRLNTIELSNANLQRSVDRITSILGTVLIAVTSTHTATSRILEREAYIHSLHVANAEKPLLLFDQES